MSSTGAGGPPAEEEMPELSDGEEAWEEEEEEEGAAEGLRTRCLFCDRWGGGGEPRGPRCAFVCPGAPPPARPRELLRRGPTRGAPWRRRAGVRAPKLRLREAATSEK